MNALTKRVLSAAVVILAVFGLFYHYREPGLLAVGYLFGILAIYEYNKMTFVHFQSPWISRIWFSFFAGLLLIVSSVDSPYVLGYWGSSLAVYLSGSIWLLHKKLPLERLLVVISLSVLGFVYCALFPSVLIRMLYLTDGTSWLLTLLLVVFFGDTFAFFGGLWFGKRKLMPELSPKKTIEGAFAGILGSLVAAILASLFILPQTSLIFLITTGLISGYVAQSGDLFESLIKRVANVKDSGAIMPGHGGVLDRMDGVLFASPVFFLAAQIYQEGGLAFSWSF